MYDFRQKRRTATAKSRPIVRSKKVVLQPLKRSRAWLTRRPHGRPKTPKESFISSLVKKLLGLGVAILLIALCLYFFVTKIATSIWPLTTVQTLILVPAISQTQAIPWVQVLIFDPTTQTAQLAELPGEMALTSTSEIRVSSLETELNAPPSSSSGVISLKLGRVVDAVVTLPTSQPLRTQAEIQHTFQDLLSQETPNLSRSQKFRWWLFTLSLSDTDVKVKNITTFSNWQSWLASMSQQQTLDGCSLALINTTPTSGLSRFVSQVMEQSGYQVIRVDSQPKFLEKSQLFLSPERLNCLGAAQRLQDFLPERIEVVQDLAATQQARADIVWLLGSDVAGQAGQVMK